MAKIAKILFACVIGLYAAALTNVAKLWWQALAQNDTAPRGELLNEKNIAPTVPHVGESQIGDESSRRNARSGAATATPKPFAPIANRRGNAHVPGATQP